MMDQPPMNDRLQKKFKARWYKQRVDKASNHIVGEPGREVRGPLPLRVELGQIHQWRVECRSSHGDCCNERYSADLERQIDNLTLVDAVDGCLVTLPTSTPFVALLYVWGNVTTLKAVRSNLEDLKRVGALFEERYASTLPETIRDSMYLVRALGERYLWVDCLSIVQDVQDEEMEKMLRAMARIYTSAEFTIVAAGGDDANHGLPGIGGPSRPRTPKTLRDRALSKGRDGFPWDSKWASRGWTFQETLFSRRLLVFDTVLSWVCGRCVWLEERKTLSSVNTQPTFSAAESKWPDERPHLGVPMGMMSLIPKVPAFGRWAMLIERFSSRNLTYEHDVDNAFAGATEIMAATFPGGLHYGLPPFFLDIALLWQPQSILKRRSGKPSWSWTGWKGSVECLSSWYPFYAGLYRHEGERGDLVAISPLKPLAIWSNDTFVQEPSLKGPTVNGFYNYQAMRSDLRIPLPIGWERHSHLEVDFFTYSGNIQTGIRYAFPIPAVDQFTGSIAVPPSPLLVCTAPIAKASLSRARNTAPQSPDLPICMPLMYNGQVVGFLIVDDIQSPEVLEGGPCELLALSEAEVVDFQRASQHLLLSNFVSQVQFGSDFSNDLDRTFYNVLWIGRSERDGVVYRKGLGLVAKRDWNKLGGETETVRLG